jgi:predicted RNA-binding Zn-ribbon protein involved in translation (DUF1610 family)
LFRVPPVTHLVAVWTVITDNFVIWMLCAGAGALIAQLKDRKLWHGALAGFLLGPLGVACAALWSRKLPEAPAGRYAVQCVTCNAIQNIPIGVNWYTCWQCEHVTVVRGELGADGRHAIRCPSCEKPLRTKAEALRFSCPDCENWADLAL